MDRRNFVSNVRVLQLAAMTARNFRRILPGRIASSDAGGVLAAIQGEATEFARWMRRGEVSLNA
jgi:hypothetical protein